MRPSSPPVSLDGPNSWSTSLSTFSASWNLPIAVERKAKLLADDAGALQRLAACGRKVRPSSACASTSRSDRKRSTTTPASTSDRLAKRRIGDDRLDRASPCLRASASRSLYFWNSRTARGRCRSCCGRPRIAACSRAIGTTGCRRADWPRAASSCRVTLAAQACGSSGTPLVVGSVGDAAQQRDVERQRRALGKQDHGAARPHRVADAEFVVHVGIGAGDVGDGVVAEHQPFEHRLMDRAADPLLVGADRFEPDRDHGRRDDLPVDRVEIRGPSGRIGLAPERHQHEAKRRLGTGLLSTLPSPPASYSIPAADCPYREQTEMYVYDRHRTSQLTEKLPDACTTNSPKKQPPKKRRARRRPSGRKSPSPRLPVLDENRTHRRATQPARIRSASGPRGAEHRRFADRSRSSCMHPCLRPVRPDARRPPALQDRCAAAAFRIRHPLHRAVLARAVRVVRA